MSRMIPPPPKLTIDDISRLATAAEKLLLETERLRRDVIRLGNRVLAFDDEVVPSALPDKLPAQRWTPNGAMTVIDEARSRIAHSEFCLNTIEARMNVILNDSWSREDLKPFLKK